MKMTIRHLLLLLLSWANLLFRPILCFSFHQKHPSARVHNLHHHGLQATTTTSTIFDFTTNSTIDSFDRIDDVIMGGISSSSMKFNDKEKCGSWRGVIRTDGGGFCGVRTLPFVEPLDVSDCDGVFMDCRLVSDDEPQRRVWKSNLRTDSSRGEQVYQAEFYLNNNNNTDVGEGGRWNRVYMPFADFRQVRGAKLVPDAPPFNTTAGLYQFGLVASQFKIATNMTKIQDFRPGFFELQILNMGVYSRVRVEEEDDEFSSSKDVSTIGKDEMMRKRPLLLKLLLPVARIFFFTEQSQRRKSAMKLLMDKRGLNRLKAILWGIQVRSNKSNVFISTMKALQIILIDSFRFILGKIILKVLSLPFKMIFFILSKLKKQSSSLQQQQ